MTAYMRTTAMEDRNMNMQQILTIVKLILTLTVMTFLLVTLRSIRTSILELKCNPRDENCSFDWLKYSPISNNNNDDDVTSQWMTSSALEQQELNRRRRNKLLIFSLPRSGSSFLGELFNRNDDVFYLYEPLHANEVLNNLSMMTSSIRKTRHKIARKLNDFYGCNLMQHEHLFRLLSYPELSNPHFRLMSKVLASPPFCNDVTSANVTEAEYRKSCRPIDTRLLTNVCMYKKSVVIKELMHRLPIYDVIEMAKLFHIENMQSLWLVRDPRAILASMMSMGWVTETKTQSLEDVVKVTVGRVCDMYQRFLITLTKIPAKLRKNFHILRYEDFVSQPRDVISQISKLSGELLNGKKSVDWVHRNTHGKSTGLNNVDSYSVLSRNATFSLTSWRFSLELRHIRLVQQKCSTAMERLGYLSLWDEKLLTNLDSPTFKELKRIL